MNFTNSDCMNKNVSQMHGEVFRQVKRQVLVQARAVVQDQLHWRVDKQIFMTRVEISWKIRR